MAGGKDPIRGEEKRRMKKKNRDRLEKPEETERNQGKTIEN
jgi:hypothetical protein